ncbi:amastin-like surface protein, putative [Leishmania donovani]|uniref:Amastin-like surface protein, putative n=1 Tax=Leishmania donovani TaxID=5661 RepID=E9BR64_LEIDO|nr:amastin-like surface protein, putative [Leishmania donovani]CBZ37743.1 amastin-like surface protein, putative [Leishmania donovani]
MHAYICICVYLCVRVRCQEALLGSLPFAALRPPPSSPALSRHLDSPVVRSAVHLRFTFLSISARGFEDGVQVHLSRLRDPPAHRVPFRADRYAAGDVSWHHEGPV